MVKYKTISVSTVSANFMLFNTYYLLISFTRKLLEHNLEYYQRASSPPVTKMAEWYGCLWKWQGCFDLTRVSNRANPNTSGRTQKSIPFVWEEYENFVLNGDYFG